MKVVQSVETRATFCQAASFSCTPRGCTKGHFDSFIQPWHGATQIQLLVIAGWLSTDTLVGHRYSWLAFAPAGANATGQRLCQGHARCRCPARAGKTFYEEDVNRFHGPVPLPCGGKPYVLVPQMPGCDGRADVASSSSFDGAERMHLPWHLSGRLHLVRNQRPTR